MEDTIITMEVATASATTRNRGHHERRGTRLRLVEPGHRQLRDLYPVCLHLLQAADTEGLALFRCVQRVSGRTVRRDVRLPAHHLFPVRMVAVALPGRGLVLA